MKQITVYEAIDGEVFDTVKECEEHERGLEVISLIHKYYSDDESTALDVADFINNNWTALCRIKLNAQVPVYSVTEDQDQDQDMPAYSFSTKDISAYLLHTR